MKLEVGMYAYSKYSRDYGIGKIVKIHTNGFTHQEVEIQYKDVKISTRYDYVIGSFNPIDLIEERDFVKVRIDGIFINWFMVDLFEDENENEQLGIGCYEDGLLNSISEYRPLNTLEILEVVTKEQMASMSYKVGD